MVICKLSLHFHLCSVAQKDIDGCIWFLKKGNLQDIKEFSAEEANDEDLMPVSSKELFELSLQYKDEMFDSYVKGRNVKLMKDVSTANVRSTNVLLSFNGISISFSEFCKFVGFCSSILKKETSPFIKVTEIEERAELVQGSIGLNEAILALSTNYRDPCNNIEYLIRILNLYEGIGEVFSRYASLCLPTMTGKTRLVLEVANKIPTLFLKMKRGDPPSSPTKVVRLLVPPESSMI
jgi:hypothetical protein